MSRKAILEKVTTKTLEVKIAQLHENLEQESSRQGKERRNSMENIKPMRSEESVYSGKGIKSIFFFTGSLIGN